MDYEINLISIANKKVIIVNCNFNACCFSLDSKFCEILQIFVYEVSLAKVLHVCIMLQID